MEPYELFSIGLGVACILLGMAVFIGMVNIGWKLHPVLFIAMTLLGLSCLAFLGGIGLATILLAAA